MVRIVTLVQLLELFSVGTKRSRKIHNFINADKWRAGPVFCLEESTRKSGALGGLKILELLYSTGLLARTFIVVGCVAPAHATLGVLTYTGRTHAPVPLAVYFVHHGWWS